MPETHMKYGGSSIKKIEICPGSGEACAPFRGLTNSHAERGTRIHKRVEIIWKLKYTKSYVPTPEETFIAAMKVDEEAIAQNVVKALEKICVDKGFSPEKMQMEAQVRLSHLSPDAGGTTDHVVWEVFGDLLIADTKAGYNFVGSFENLQMLFYASGALQGLSEFVRASIQNIHLVILQPEQEYPYTVNVNIHTIPATDMAKYDARFKAAIERAEREPHVRIPGGHCQDMFCDARTVCEPYKLWLNEMTSGAFAAALKGNTQLPGVGEVLAKQLDVAPALRSLANLIESQAKSLLDATPDAVPGWTLKDSMGNRAWSNLKSVDEKAKELGLKPDEFKPREIVTPAAFERLLQSKGLTKPDAEASIEDLTSRSVTGRKLVKTDAPVQTLGDKFTDLMNKSA